MKGKLLLTALVAGSLAGSNAFASIARQAVLGNQPVWGSNTVAGSSNAATSVNVVNGSLWYDDDFNVFYNPSYVMDNKNSVTFNKGLEGGFFSGMFENFAYGIYVNRGNSTFNGTGGDKAGMTAPGLTRQNAYAGSASTALTTTRPVDFFIAGDTGVKWGVHVAWAYNRDQQIATATKSDAEATARYWHVDFGAQVMGFEPFVGATLASSYQNDIGADVAKQNLDEINAGVRYKYEGWTPYVAYHKYREWGNATTITAFDGRQVQTTVSAIGGGVGHDTKVADGVHVLKNIGVWWFGVEDDAAIGEKNKDYTDFLLPINVAIEADATSWLTLRAGARYDLIAQRKYAHQVAAPATNTLDDKAVSLSPGAGSLTNVRIGATFKFGKLHLDSAFGTGTTAVNGTENIDSSSIGFDSQTFAVVSAAYHW